MRLLKQKAITFDIRSTGSVQLAAAFKYIGAADQKSTMRWIEDRGSKILIGSEMCEIERPFSRFTASCFATLGSTPFCALSISSSVQTRLPSAFISRPTNTSSRFVGKGLRSMATGRSLGGGHSSSGGENASAKELDPTSRLFVS